MKLERNGLISLSSFIIGLFSTTYVLVELCQSTSNWIKWIKFYPWIYFLFYFAITSIIWRICFCQKTEWKIAVLGNFLGVVFGSSITLLILQIHFEYWQFYTYISILSFFHFSEYLTTAVSNPNNLSLDSYLLNHSLSYWLAAMISWIEYFIQAIFVPEMKSFWYISIIGLLMCIFGEVLRKTAMLTADRNFNHIVQTKRQSGHKLITSGVYSFSRHPSYLGWFWWSIGTQILLINPLCTVIYTAASWYFFNSRIYYEEMALVNFFKEEYFQYQEKVGTGLPFIKGYVMNDR